MKIGLLSQEKISSEATMNFQGQAVSFGKGSVFHFHMGARYRSRGDVGVSQIFFCKPSLEGCPK